MPETPIRLPDTATVEAVLKDLDPASADADLAPALSAAFHGFAFSIAPVDYFYWRNTDRTVIDADGARLGAYDVWVKQELDALGGDLDAFWKRYRDSGLKFSEWRGRTVFAFAPTGPGVAEFVQVSLCREIEVLAGPVVDPGSRPWSIDDLLEAPWVSRDPKTETPVLAAPIYRLSPHGSLVHMRTFLELCQRLEREFGDARRPIDLETGFMALDPDRFDFVPRTARMFQDWERSSASADRIFEHWAFDIGSYLDRGQRRLRVVPRPLKMPTERLLAADGVSVHRLMERIEAIDSEVGLHFAWFFLMTHGHWVDPDVGEAIAGGLRAEQIRLPVRDAAVLLEWANNRYLF